MEEVEINVLNLVSAMAKELVEPPVDELDSEAVETCEMIDEYIVNNDVLDYGVAIDKGGNVTVSTEGRDGVTVSFEFEL